MKDLTKLQAMDIRLDPKVLGTNKMSAVVFLQDVPKVRAHFVSETPCKWFSGLVGRVW